MLALLTAPSQTQVGLIVGVAESEAPLTSLEELERGTALVFLNLPDDRESGESCHCFCHEASPIEDRDWAPVQAPGPPAQSEPRRDALRLALPAQAVERPFANAAGKSHHHSLPHRAA